jgi:hypothetical protein
VKKCTKLSSRELQFLSAYLDGELSEKDQKRVERLLSVHPAAPPSLEKLRHVKSVLKLLPIHKVPRNFTISAEEVGRSQIPTLTGVLRYASAVSAVLLVVVLAIDFISPYQLADSELGLARSAAETTFEEKIVASVEEEGPIITRQPTDPPASDGYGIGGGDDGTDDLDLQNEIPLTDVIITPSDDQIEEMPSIAQEVTAAETEQLPQVIEEQSQADGEKSRQESESPKDESGSILGIHPSESQGTIESFDEMSESVIEVPEMISLRLLEIVLAGLTIVAALLAGFLRKRKN